MFTRLFTAVLSLAALMSFAPFPAQAQTPSEPPRHVFVIVMENHNWDQIAGSRSAPYINGTLLPMGAHAEAYMNLLHPSEPNYLWIEAGTAFGIRNDRDPAANHQATTAHLTYLLDEAGISWTSYQEDISGDQCPLVSFGRYAAKHNPMVYFDDVTNGNDSQSANCIAHVRPYSELAGDLAGGTVARYNFISPNTCHDMHDLLFCDSLDRIKNGDSWLAEALPPIFASDAYQQGGIVFIVWDESNGNAPIGLIALSPDAKAGYANSIPYSHSSLLRSLQEIFDVQPFLGDAANATDLSDLFVQFP